MYTAGLTNATAMEFAPDGRLFVCEQAGNLRVISHGIMDTHTGTLADRGSRGERGL